PQAVQRQGHRRRAHAYMLVARPGERLQIRRRPDLLAHPRHNPQVVQPFDPHARHVALTKEGFMLSGIPPTRHDSLRNVGLCTPPACFTWRLERVELSCHPTVHGTTWGAPRERLPGTRASASGGLLSSGAYQGRPPASAVASLTCGDYLPNGRCITAV